ncbi:MAG: type 1 glutamine amidotransferase [Bacilli bacterium]|jgi:putative glutamine amidotransferase
MGDTLKIIGIPIRQFNAGGKIKEFVNQVYLNALKKYNFEPLLLTTENIKTKELFKFCDGFIIPGGDDLNPVYFDEEDTGLSKEINPEVDLIDQITVDYAKTHKIPLLGICRGIQAINVFLGGSLYQDIGKDHKHIISDHKVVTYPNRFLKFKETIAVNSYHHQAIKKLAPELSVIAKHIDGTIEAVIHNKLPIFGVQWHPELIPDSEETKIIFRAFQILVARKNS